MWLILFAISVGTFVSVLLSIALNWPIVIISFLLSAILLKAIVKDTQSEAPLYGYLFLIIILGMFLADLVEKQSSFIFGAVYDLALIFAVYSSWKIYIGLPIKD